MRFLACILVLWWPAASLAASPVKPLRILIGFPAGSSIDLFGRFAVRAFEEHTGRTAIIENRPGATGLIANELVARSQPKERVMLLAPSSSLLAAPLFVPHPPYDPLTDFVPVIQLVVLGSYVLACHPSVPARSVQELIALAKKEPTRLMFGSPGVGSLPHLAVELFARMTDTEMRHIPYKGLAEATKEVAGGEIDLVFTSAIIAQSVRHKLRILAVTGKVRSARLPAVPTIHETGVPGYEVVGWYGIVAPKNAAPLVVNHLNGEFAQALKSERAARFFGEQDAAFVPNTPAQFAKTVRADYRKYQELIESLQVQ